MPLDKQITIPLQEFLTILWHKDHNQWSEVPVAIGHLLVALDPNNNLYTADESLYHVEFLENDNATLAGNNIMPMARVWRMRAWRVAAEKDKASKIRSELERQQRFLRDENITRLAIAIVGKMLGAMTLEEARQLASTLIFKAGEKYDSAQYKTIKAAINAMYNYNLRELKSL